MAIVVPSSLAVIVWIIFFFVQTNLTMIKKTNKIKLQNVDNVEDQRYEYRRQFLNNLCASLKMLKPDEISS